MNKQTAIEIMSRAAAIYRDVFCNKNLLIVYGNEKNPEYLETKSLPRNFLHLTGMALNHNVADNTAERFLERVLTHNLDENDFNFKDSSTEQKLRVLVQTLNIKSNVKMFGDFSGNRVNLKTDKLAGGVNSYLGFVKVGDDYVPNTVIEGNIKHDTFFQYRVLAILSKKINDPFYDKKIYIAKKIDIDRLLQTLKSNVPISQNLFSSAQPFISSPPDVNMFASLPSPEMGGGAAVLTPPRFSFGQSLANLINKWADKIGEGIERRKRELQIAKQENNELKKELTERDEQLTQKDEIIKELHAEKKDLTLELIEQKRLFREATRKTLDEKFAEAKQRCRERKTEKSPHLPEQRKDKYRK